MRRHTCNLIAIAATMLIMWACGGNDVTYCEFRQLSAYVWAYGDTIGFPKTNMTDSIADGHLVVSLRHNNGYPYSNIWLELTRTGNDGTTVRDTVNCVLADLYGRWKGQGFGASYQFSDTLPNAVRLLRGDSITVRHIMRTDTITDIEHLGIMLVP